MPSVGPFIKIQKFATDVLGNIYEVKDNRLKIRVRLVYNIGGCILAKIYMT